MASTRAAVSTSRSRKAGGAAEGGKVGGIGGQDFRRGGAQRGGHGVQRGIALGGWAAGQHVRGGARGLGGALEVLGGFGVDVHGGVLGGYCAAAGPRFPGGNDDLAGRGDAPPPKVRYWM